MTTINLQPDILDLELYRGDDYPLEFQWLDEDDNPYDLTGYLIKAQMRKERNSVSIVAVFDVIQRDDANGRFVIHLEDTATQALKINKAYWDLQLSRAGDVITLVEGEVSFIHDVTR